MGSLLIALLFGTAAAFAQPGGPAPIMGDAPAKGEYRIVLAHKFQADRGEVPAVETLDFSRDGSMLVTGASDGVVRLWDTRSGKLIRRMKGDLEYVRKVLFDPYDEHVYACGADGTIKTWEVRTGRLYRKQEAHADIALCIAMSPNTHLLASSGSDSRINIWQRRTGALDKSIQFEDGLHLNYLEFSPNGKWLAATATNYSERTEKRPNMTDQVYILRTVDWQDTVSFASNDAERAVFSPDGQMLATTEFSIVVLREVFTGTVKDTLKGHDSFVNDVVFHPRGELVATTGDDGKIILWNLREGTSLEPDEQHGSMVTSVAINHFGDMMASGDEQGWVYLWQIDIVDPETGEPFKQRKTW